MLLDPLPGFIEISAFAASQDAQSIEALVYNRLLSLHFRREQINSLPTWYGLDQRTPPLVIPAEQFIEAVDGKCACWFTTDLLEYGPGINLLRRIELIPLRNQSLLRRRPDSRKGLLSRLAQIIPSFITQGVDQPRYRIDEMQLAGQSRQTHPAPSVSHRRHVVVQRYRENRRFECA